MGRAKIVLDKNILEKLYIDQNLSPYKLADRFGCSFSTITNRLKEYEIPLKSASVARQKYFKSDFSGTSAEKCYMIGFRIGDLNVYQTNPNSEVIVVRCHTTTQDQLEVIKKLFEKNGKVTISRNRGGSYHINCFLNKTFQFLIDKNDFVRHIMDSEDFFAFFAGYLDAEGYIGLNQGRARLKIDSYDKNVLEYISNMLEKLGIKNKLKMISICKENRNFGKHLFRLNINSAKDLDRLIGSVQGLMLHQKRLAQVKTAQNNIKKRINGYK